MAASMGDIQMRMSKKIAQLTKVIYHLNNKNEEHELDLQEIAEQYEIEIEQVLKDAADKINAFKHQLDTDRDDVRLNTIVKKLESKYSEERAKAAADLEAVQLRAQEKEAAIQKAASKQLQVLAEQAENLKQQLQLRVREVDELKLNSSERHQGLEQSLQRAKKELEEAITTGNKKYNDMLAARLKAEDDLRDELLQSQGLLNDEKTARLAAEQKHKTEQDGWIEEKARLANLLQDTESSWKVKSESLLTNIKKEQSARESIEQTAASLSDELQQQALELQRSVARGQQLEADIAETKLLLVEKEELLVSSSYECASLKQQLVDATNTHEANTTALQGKLDTVLNRSAELEALLQAINAKADSSMASATEQLLMLKKELNHVNAEVEDARRAVTSKTQENEDLSSQLLRAKVQLKKCQTENDEKTAGMQRKLEGLQRDYDQAVKDHESNVAALQAKLQKATQDTLSATSAASAATQQTKAELEQRLANCIASHKEELQGILKQHQHEVASIKNNSKEALDEERQKSQQCIVSLESRLQSLEQDASAESRKHQQETHAMQLKLKQFESDVMQLIAQLEEQTNRATQAELQSAEMQSRLSNTSQTADAAQAELEKKVKMYGLAEAALKEEIQISTRKLRVLEDELKGRAQAVVDLRSELQQAKEELQRKIIQLTGAQESRIAELQVQWSSQLESEVGKAMQKQDALHKQQLLDLQSSLQQQGRYEVTEARARMQAELQEKEAYFVTRLQELQDHHAKELHAIKQAQQDDRSLLLQQHQQNLDAVHKEHQQKIRSLEAGLRGDMAGALEKVKAEHRMVLQDAEGRYQLQLDSLQHSAAAEQDKASTLLQQTIDEWSRKYSAEVARLQALREEERQELQAKHASVLDDLQSSSQRKEEELAKSISGLDKRRAELQQQLQDLGSSKAAVEAALEQAKDSLANKSTEMTDTLYRMKREFENERSAMEQDFKRQRAALVEENSTATAVMTADYERAMSDMNARVDQLMQEFLHLQEIYNNRPPRDEDIQRIQQLEQTLQATEEQLRTAEERMQQLRSEMLLREENYNKHFKNGGMGERVLNVGAAMNATESVTSWMLKSKRSNSGRS